MEGLEHEAVIVWLPMTSAEPATHRPLTYLPAIGEAHAVIIVSKPRVLEAPALQIVDTKVPAPAGALQEPMPVSVPKTEYDPPTQRDVTYLPDAGSLQSVNTVLVPNVEYVPLVHRELVYFPATGELQTATPASVPAAIALPDMHRLDT